MRPADPAVQLQRLALHRRWERRASGIAVALGCGSLAGSALHLATESSISADLAAGIATSALVALLAFLVARRHPIDARLIARHFDREVPALEESTELLLAEPASLTPVARLQRARTAGVVGQLATLPRLPHRAARSGWLGAVAAGLLAVGGLVVGPGVTRAPGTSPSPAVTANTEKRTTLPRIEAVEIGVSPPSYTGRPARRGTDWDLEVEEGARVGWTIVVDRPGVRAVLRTSEGDTIGFAPTSDRRLGAILVPSRGVAYQVILSDPGWPPVASDFHLLRVRPDAPPLVTVIRPAPRTTVQPGTSPVVPLQVLASDDYRITDAHIVATLARGSGEGVTFREQGLEFARVTTRPSSGGPAAGQQLTLQGAIDLQQLGLHPGDELYFHVSARDNRRPAPNQTRSETFFVSLADTAQVPAATMAGVSVDLTPAYFRSQRQIIIDTEKLIADRGGLPREEFRGRSNNLGIDQQLLRLRYSEFVGDESVPAPAASDRDPAPAGIVPEPGAPDLRAERLHPHDVEENATLLAASVKASLRASLAEMWHAELKLRSYDPDGALPYEYRALELLKQTQQSARAYVQKVGFEPPPLEPDKRRLTGSLAGVTDPSEQRSIVPQPTLPSLRQAFGVLQRLDLGLSPAAADVSLLENAGLELARRALDEPGHHLETLRALRVLIGALGEPGRCPECRRKVEQGLWNALPSPESSPAARWPVTALARSYFDFLHTSR